MEKSKKELTFNSEKGQLINALIITQAPVHLERPHPHAMEALVPDEGSWLEDMMGKGIGFKGTYKVLTGICYLIRAVFDGEVRTEKIFSSEDDY